MIEENMPSSHVLIDVARLGLEKVILVFCKQDPPENKDLYSAQVQIHTASGKIARVQNISMAEAERRINGINRNLFNLIKLRDGLWRGLSEGVNLAFLRVDSMELLYLKEEIKKLLEEDNLLPTIIASPHQEFYPGIRYFAAWYFGADLPLAVVSSIKDAKDKGAL